MKIKDRYKRLFRLWGRIDSQHNQKIASHIEAGSTVLDIGCGYGSLLSHLQHNGIQAAGIDIEQSEIDIALSLFPDIKIDRINAEALTGLYPPEHFDTIIFKDCFHHIVGEHDASRVAESLRYVLKPKGRVIIFDPNPNWILRIGRRIIAHQDPEAKLEFARQWLQENGFTVQGVEFYEMIGLILSGGYVGPELIPNWPFLQKSVAALNRWFSALIVRIGLGRQLCWRYLIYADKN